MIVSFVEEMVMNPKYEHCMAGRMEILGTGLEVRFFTAKTEELSRFIEYWDMQEVVSEKELERLCRRVKEDYNEICDSA